MLVVRMWVQKNDFALADNPDDYSEYIRLLTGCQMGELKLERRKMQKSSSVNLNAETNKCDVFFRNSTVLCSVVTLEVTGTFAHAK